VLAGALKGKITIKHGVPTGSRVRIKDRRTRAAWIAASGVDPAVPQREAFPLRSRRSDRLL